MTVRSDVFSLWGWGDDSPQTRHAAWCGWTLDAKPLLLESALFTKSGGHHGRWKWPVWVIDYAFATEDRYRVGSKAQLWRPRLARTLHLYPPGTVYWEDTPKDAKGPSRWAFLKFIGGETARLHVLVPPRSGYVRFLDPEGIAGQLLNDIVDIHEQFGSHGFWRAQSVLCMLISRLQESEHVEGEIYRIGSPAAAAAPSGLVQRVNAYLAECVGKPCRLEDMARHLNVSVALLSHRYRKETGETPREHLLRLRLSTARTMLLSGQTLAAIAAATGFSDAFHLSRTFKRTEGQSPRAYLKHTRP